MVPIIKGCHGGLSERKTVQGFTQCLVHCLYSYMVAVNHHHPHHHETIGTFQKLSEPGLQRLCPLESFGTL